MTPNRPAPDAWREGLHAVARPRAHAATAYDRASRWYGWLEEPFERAARDAGLRLLDARPGERVADLGCGPGGALLEVARAVGSDGLAAGLDLSPRMVDRAAARARRAGLADRVDLRVGDAARPPWPDGSFDAAFASFALETFDTPEILPVLDAWRRLVRPGGRLVVVSLSREVPVRWPTRLYERLHDRFPAALDCRPIHAAKALAAAGLIVTAVEPVPLFGLRAEAVRAEVPGPSPEVGSPEARRRAAAPTIRVAVTPDADPG
jgi:ubiquinone/menaquinone biosynthesis C-methylase UbiE